MQDRRLIGLMLVCLASAWFAPMPVCPATLHVEPAGVDDAGRNGLTWGTAFASINYAFGRATGGDTILVSNGNYNVASATSITKDITIMSLNGSVHTILNGMGGTHNAFTGGSGAPEIVLRGFTITNFLRGGIGGGVFMVGCIFKNCLFAGNEGGSGGGVYFNRNYSEMLNCAFVDNYARSSGGGFFKRSGGEEILLNTIIYNNNVGSGTTSNYSTTSGITFTNCITAPDVGAAGTDCYVVDPELDAEFKPIKGAPAINKGLNQDWMIGAKDLAGHPRIAEEIVDIGAYEYHPPGAVIRFW